MDENRMDQKLNETELGDETKVFERLKEEAESIQVPEELNPENIRIRLEAERKKNRRSHRKQLVASAAAIVVLVGTAVTGTMVWHQQKLLDTNTMTKQVADIDNLYQAASDYNDVYEELEHTQKDQVYTSGADGAVDGATSSIESSVNETADATDASAEKDYSTTNLQTEGVDESDIIKTDGKYIYTVWNHKVEIYDISNITPQKVAEITPEADSAADEVEEMYLDNNQLILIMQKQEAALQPSDSEESLACSDTYYMTNRFSTQILTYDISDKAAPVLSQSMKQDGTYHTSRKVGAMLYLFTDYWMQLPQYEQETAVDAKLSTWIPSVGDELIDADNIYLPENGNYGLIISSVNCQNLDKPLDTKMIVQNTAEVYVSNTSIYLYGNGDLNSSDTQIARFAMDDGKITPIGASVVNGYVMDTFAINEYDGYLRVLTTDWDDGNNENGNAVYVYDGQMKLVGQITGIAPGEEIYSARFLKNTGYFVTYHNTDPLFTVDFSDPKNPVLTGELKITGFSEYLHFWGDDKLLGLGYETDPKTGVRQGLKLSMFNISDPSNVTEESKLVIDNADDSPALYNYKCVLADVGKNLIGFAINHYGENVTQNYLVFSYENGFVNQLSESLENDETDGENYRGLYIGNYFYLTENGTIRVYDMNNSFQSIP